MAHKGQLGVSCSFDNTMAKHNRWEKTGNAKCTNCEYLEWGYYCSKKKQTAEWPNRIKHCDSFKKIMTDAERKKKKEKNEKRKRYYKKRRENKKKRRVQNDTNSK